MVKLEDKLSTGTTIKINSTRQLLPEVIYPGILKSKNGRHCLGLETL